MIFWGPPGVGKTTLAQIIATSLEKPFRQLSAIQAGVKEVREVLAFARSRPGTILFIDEIHRFNKSQQDSLLGAVEKGLIVLIGATTENPSFEVNSALLSRSQDIVSAFIKSIRGGDPNGAIYWLARMLTGGEDVKFIARRLVISASEDIGNANPNALLLANACFDSVAKIGMPEARIVLAQTTTYLATSEKSNASYVSINKAMKFVKNHPDYPVPMHLRNAPTKMMKESGYGKGYKYSHDFQGAQGNQEYLPEGMEGMSFYLPKHIGSERNIRKYVGVKWGGKYELGAGPSLESE
ncbi:UNVERIFIED_CONTAM: hypothetical protein GTU68_029094 [Idotea baltica]|nr:hypothetical protein [Idotea baltica]